MEERDLTGRVAVVTGASRRAGIGASIARELAYVVTKAALDAMTLTWPPSSLP